MNREIIDNYNKILETFIILFPDKKDKIPVNLSDTEIMGICTSIVVKTNSVKNYKSLLLANKCKLFKAIKLSFIPKIKMELVLVTDKNDSKERLSNITLIWTNIKNIFIAFEKLKDDIDYKYIELLENKNNDINDLQKMQNSLLDEKTLALLEGFGVNKSQVSGLFNEINSADQTIGNDFIRTIIAEIKNTPLYKNRTTEKVSLKDIIANTKELQEKYISMLSDGDLNMSSVVASLMTLLTNQTEYDKVLKELDIENLVDTDNVIMDLTELLPAEYKPLISMLVSQSSEGSDGGFNPMDLIGSLLGNNKKEVKELSQEQLKELEDFYSNLNI